MFSRWNWDKIHWTVFSGYSFGLLEYRNALFSLPVFCNLSQLLQLSEDDQQWHHNDISQLPQHLWCQVPDAMDCCMSFKCSLAWYYCTERKYSLFQTFLLVSESCISLWPVLLVKTQAKRHWIHFHLLPAPHTWWAESWLFLFIPFFLLS